MKDSKQTYLIKYSILDKSANVIKWGEVRVKNKLSELQAKIGLETYLRKRHIFNKLIIHECKIDWKGFIDNLIYR